MKTKDTTLADNKQRFFKPADSGLLHLTKLDNESLSVLHEKLSSFFAITKEEKPKNFFEKLFAPSA
jgi:hypothetical protein